MEQAWPRFLPGTTAAATAHALVIEAHAILVEECIEPRGDLIDAHRRALSYARDHYGEEDVRRAWDACAAANRDARPDHLMTLLIFGAEMAWRTSRARRAPR